MYRIVSPLGFLCWASKVDGIWHPEFTRLEEDAILYATAEEARKEAKELGISKAAVEAF